MATVTTGKSSTDADQVSEAHKEVATQISVTDLAAPELDRDLDPVAVLEKLDRASNLGLEVAFADLDLDPDLFEVDRALVLAGLLLLARLFVLELAVVE